MAPQKSGTHRSTASRSEGTQPVLTRDNIAQILEGAHKIVTRDQLVTRRNQSQTAKIDPHNFGIATAPIHNYEDTLFSFDYNGSPWKLGFNFGVYLLKVYILKGAFNRHAIQYQTEHGSAIRVNETEFSNDRELLVMMETVIATVRRGRPDMSPSFRNTPVTYTSKMSLRKYMSDIRTTPYLTDSAMIMALSKDAKITLKSNKDLINSEIPITTPITKPITIRFDQKWNIKVTPGSDMIMTRDYCQISLVLENDERIIKIDETKFSNEEMRYMMMHIFIFIMKRVFPKKETVIEFTRRIPFEAYMTLKYQQTGGSKPKRCSMRR
jgi:hypothetical protein